MFVVIMLLILQYYKMYITWLLFERNCKYVLRTILDCIKIDSVKHSFLALQAFWERNFKHKNRYFHMIVLTLLRQDVSCLEIFINLNQSIFNVFGIYRQCVEKRAYTYNVLSCIIYKWEIRLSNTIFVKKHNRNV